LYNINAGVEQKEKPANKYYPIIVDAACAPLFNCHWTVKGYVLCIATALRIGGKNNTDQ
jgi:hypothetical protein